MGYILDALLVLIFAASVVHGAKRGFFKSLMALISGIIALLLAFTFTPALSSFVNETFVIDGMTEGIESTFLSIAEIQGEDGEQTYELTALVRNGQFLDMMEDVGVTEEQLLEICERDDVDIKAQIGRFARMVAEPLAGAVSDIVSFIILFVIALILLKLITFAVGLVFKLPVLRSFDRGLGIVFGILSGLFFVFTFAMAAEALTEAIAGASPASFTTDVIKESLIIGALVKYNPLKALLSLLG